MDDPARKLYGLHAAKPKNEKKQTMTFEEYLGSIYYDPKKPGSFSGPRALYKAVKSEGKRVISMSKIMKWLKSQDVYTTHRRMIRKFKRNKVQVDKIDEQWDLDLIDMIDLAKENNGVKYVMVAIDIFSRYAFAQPLVNKQASTVRAALEKMMNDGRKAQRIRTDPGGEFCNKLVNTWFEKQNILHTVTHNEVKANYAERFIKTLKSKIIKYLQQNNTLKYVNTLQDFVTSYNDTYHSSIKMRPNSVNDKNEQMLWEQQYVEPFVKADKLKKKQKQPTFKYKIGDRVRVSYLRTLFQREYHQKWSGEIFTVITRWMREGIPVYELKDYGGDSVAGTFYQPELQAIHFDDDQNFKVEKVLKSRGRGKNKEHYVKWMNWPAKYNSWVKDLHSFK